MANKIVTFTTYKNDGLTSSGTPFVFGFTDKLGNNEFDNTGTALDADLEIPPPPPPGSASTGNPISTSYINTMYVKVYNGSTDINAYQYFIDSSDNSDISLNLAVRDYTADDVVFKYNDSDVSGVFTTLAITNDVWTIDLVGASVSGTGPTISSDGDERTVTLPHLGNDLFYTMNLKQYVADSGPVRLRGDTDNNGSVGINDVVHLITYLAFYNADGFSGKAQYDDDLGFLTASDTDNNGSVGINDVVYLVSHLAFGKEDGDFPLNS